MASPATPPRPGPLVSRSAATAQRPGSPSISFIMLCFSPGKSERSSAGCWGWTGCWAQAGLGLRWNLNCHRAVPGRHCSPGVRKPRASSAGFETEAGGVTGPKSRSVERGKIRAQRFFFLRLQSSPCFSFAMLSFSRRAAGRGVGLCGQEGGLARALPGPCCGAA